MNNPQKSQKSQKKDKAVKKSITDQTIEEILARLGDDSMAGIYRHRIRTIRTRRYELPAPARGSRPGRIEIMHTLLGIELKIGKRRLMCPDLSTARYLSVFARLGLIAVAIPYDITRVARLADDLESAWFRMVRLVEESRPEASVQSISRMVRQLEEHQRLEIEAIGPGPVSPQFNR